MQPFLDCLDRAIVSFQNRTPEDPTPTTQDIIDRAKVFLNEFQAPLYSPRIQELEAQLAEARTAQADITSTLTRERGRWEQTRQEGEAQVARLTETNQDLRQELIRAREENRELKGQNRDLSAKLENALQDIHSLNVANEKLDTRLRRLVDGPDSPDPEYQDGDPEYEGRADIDDLPNDEACGSEECCPTEEAPGEGTDAMPPRPGELYPAPAQPSTRITYTVEIERF